MLQGVIFDFDGLILETETPEMRSWDETFRHYGCEYPEWYWRFMLGRGADQMPKTPYELLLDLGGKAPESEVLAHRGRLLEGMLSALEIMPGVVDRLDEAAELGLQIGVASSSHHAWVDAHLERLGLLNHFRHISCKDDCARAKPFPDLYLHCCEHLGIDPARTVAFEDSVNGSLAAREAGLYVVAVPTHLTVREDLAAHLVVDSLTEVRLSEIAVSVK